MKQVIIASDRLNNYRKGQVLNYGTANNNLNILIETLLNNGEAELVNKEVEVGVKVDVKVEDKKVGKITKKFKK